MVGQLYYYFSKEVRDKAAVFPTSDICSADFRDSQNLCLWCLKIFRLLLYILLGILSPIANYHLLLSMVI